MSKIKILLNWKGVETSKGLRNKQSESQEYKITPTLRCSTVAVALFVLMLGLLSHVLGQWSYFCW